MRALLRPVSVIRCGLLAAALACGAWSALPTRAAAEVSDTDLDEDDGVDMPSGSVEDPDTIAPPPAQPRAHDEIPFPDAVPRDPDEIKPPDPMVPD